MKKRLLKMLSLSFILAVFAGFAGCNSENVDWEPAEISVNPKSIVFDAGDIDTPPAPIDVEVVSSRTWTVSEDMADWIRTSINEGPEGRTTVTIIAELNPTDKVRKSTVTFMVGQRLTAVLKVEQKGEGGVEPSVEIYREDVGSKVEKVDNAWPFVDAFEGWSRAGTLSQTGVTYTGDMASVRNSGSGYQPAEGVATGAPYVFLGGGAPFFQINKINITGLSNFTFNMAVSYEKEYVAGTVTFNPITSTSFKLEGSVDGTAWTTLPFTNDATEGWVVTTSEFKTDGVSKELYIKISNPVAPSKMRFDDFTLTEGGAGTIVIGEVVTEPKATTGDANAITDVTATLNGSFATPEGVTATEVGFEYKTGAGAFVAVAAAAVTPSFSVNLTGLTASTLYTYKAYVKTASGTAYGDEKTFTTTSGGSTGDVIYSENVGTAVEKVGGFWPYVDEFTGWSRAGTPNQAGVLYTGVSASVRNSGNAYQPAEGVASGAPYVFLGTGVPHFLISKINITGHSNFTFKTAVSYENAYVAGAVTFHPVTSTSFKLEGSVDGATWTALTFANAATEGWVVTTSEFKTNGTANELYIRISEPATVSKMRFDDFTLTSGGAGTIVIGGGVPAEPKATTGDAASITATTATLNGSYSVPAGVTATEAGVEYKTGAGAFVAVAAATVTPSFSVDLTGLTESTIYTYKAYVKTASGTVYGEEKTFTTTSLVKTYITLAELRAKGETTITEDVYVKGSVISGTNSGSKKNVIVSDGAAGIAIRFVGDYEFAQEIGKEIEISLNGAVLALYNGLLQINGLPNAQAVATGEIKLIAATPITSTQLISGSYESMYVAVSDVQVVSADLAKTVGSATTNTSIMIESLTDEFVMYTTRYADFVADAVPTGSGVLKGVASVNLTTYQIYPQTRADYSAMTGARLSFPLAFGAADFAGTLKVGDVASGNIVIPYTYAKGTESYNVTVVVSGDAAAGVTVAPMTANITVAGDGNIEIPVTGTPTIEGGITFTVSGITGLAAADAVATADVFGAGAKVIYLNEAFDVFNSSTIEYPSAEGSPNLAAAGGTAKPGTDVTDLPGWTGAAVFKAKGMVKMGAGSGLGFIITSALSDIVGTQDVSLTFDAGAWSGDKNTIKVSIIGDGTFDDGVLTEVISGVIPNDGTPLVSQTLTIKGATASTRIVFEAMQSSKSRFFIDNVKVVQL